MNSAMVPLLVAYSSIDSVIDIGFIMKVSNSFPTGSSNKSGNTISIGFYNGFYNAHANELSTTSPMDSPNVYPQAGPMDSPFAHGVSNGLSNGASNGFSSGFSYGKGNGNHQKVPLCLQMHDLVQPGAHDWPYFVETLNQFHLKLFG